jgi:hypothetical protein
VVNKLFSFIKFTKWIQLVFLLQAIYIFVVFKYNDGFNLIFGKTEMTPAALWNAGGLFVAMELLSWYLYNQDLAKNDVDKLFEESDVVGNLRR